MTKPFCFACPSCKTGLLEITTDELQCPTDGGVYIREQGIWRFLTPQKNLEYWQFIHEYETVRMSEGRGSTDPNYYRTLPFQDLTGRYASDWKIRSQSYQALLNSVIIPFEKKAGRPLKVIDLGAGNCWLSYRLAQRGHLAAAVDLQTNARDGLGAYIYYDAGFVALQADFHHLPFFENQADLAIFNASFHYSTNYLACLCEALRVLRADGLVVILDSPIYRESNSGEQMVREREASYRQSYGFASNAIPSENFLTYARLEELGSHAGLQWRLVKAFYGLSWALRPLRAFVAGRREPAQFRIAIGSRNQ